MTLSPDDALARLRGRSVALFLDIDGTLLEHKPHPDDVFVDDDLRRLVEAAIEKLDGAVALVTGRSLEMVDRLFGPLALPSAGLYGLEHRLIRDGSVEYANEPEDMRAVADALELEFRETEGIYFERKGPVLAVHTRAAPAALPSVRAAAEKALANLSDGYRILAGNAGLEFLPIGALKSGAIERLMGVAPFKGRVPVFLGDDTADESGFEFVNNSDGLSVRIKPNGPTEAQLALPDVAAARTWLADLVEHK